MKLAVVGRPNVGKSFLFNRIVKKRIAIVDEEEGVTRDRISAKAFFEDKSFEVIDTGGIDFFKKDELQNNMTAQAFFAMEAADAVVMVVDGKTGITELDRKIAKILLKEKKPIFLAVNKMDRAADENFLYQFSCLGIKEIVAVSALNDRNISLLLKKVLKDGSFSEEDSVSSIKIALIGRPNSGKSTLFNTLLEENRSIVSEIAGTTKDSIDVCLSKDGEHFTFIDTAGIRRKNKEKTVLEKYAFLRTEESIDKADICLFLLDVREGITSQDKKILSQISEKKKGCILLFNKWDLVHGFRMEHCSKSIDQSYSYLPHLFISAKAKRNTDKIFSLIKEVEKERRKKISTSVLNAFMEKCMQRCHPPMILGKRLRIYYLTQLSSLPPHFLLFINYKNLLTRTYKKYLINQFRKEFGFKGIPIEFEIRQKKARSC